MAFFTEKGLDLNAFKLHRIGPVVFYEHIYYFREAFLGTPLTVSLEMTGLAEDGRFFEFKHDFYDPEGNNLAHCEMMGAFIDMHTRKLTGLPDELLNMLNAVERPADFRVLTRDDTRKNAKAPKKRA